MHLSTFLQVAREGWYLMVPVLAVGALLVLAGAGSAFLVVAVFIAAALAAYFQDSDRKVPPVPLGIVAPVDGRIIHRRECHDPFLDREAIRIGIEVDRFGAYYLRAPIEGTLFEVRPRKPSPAAQKASWIQTDERDDIVVLATEGTMLGRRPCVAGFGQRVGQGRRCGSRRLVRRIDLYLPAATRVEVRKGDIVRAGSDVLATLVHNAYFDAARSDD